MMKVILKYPGILIVVVAETHKQLSDTTLREFISIMPEEMIKQYNKSSSTFTMFNGATVLFRSFPDPLTIRSISAGLIVFEEMSQLSDLLFQESRGRLRQKGMPNKIIAATNPGSYDNFCYKLFIGQQDKDGNLLPDNKKDKRFHVIYSKSHDNKALPKEYLADLDSLKESNPEAHRQLVLGHWGVSPSGQIYSILKDQRIKQLSQKKEDYDQIICGVDFGFRHPTGISIIGYQDEKVSVIDEVYRYSLVSNDIINICKQKQLEYNIEVFYCDSARPEIIQDMVDAGLNALPAYKGAGSVIEGITHIKSLIADQLFYVSSNCPNTLKEIGIYSWRQDKTSRDGDKSSEQPIKASDDLLDSIRYAIFTHNRESRDQFEMTMISPSGFQHR